MNTATSESIWSGLQNKDNSVSSEMKSMWSIYPKSVVYIITACLALGAVSTGAVVLVKLSNLIRINDRLSGVESRMDAFDKSSVVEQNARKASDEKMDRFIWQYEQFRKMDAASAMAFDRKLDEILKSMNSVTATVTSMQMDASTRSVTIESRLNSIKEQSLNAFDIANELSKRVSDVELHQAVDAKNP